jgi:hypothetical protein
MAAVISAPVVPASVISAPVITTAPPTTYNRPITAAPTVSIAIGVITVAGVITVIAGCGSAAVIDIASITVALYVAITRGDVATGKCARKQNQSNGCKQVFDG